MIPALLLVNVLVAPAAAAPPVRLGTTGLSAEVHTGIGGLIGRPAEEYGLPDPGVDEAWRKFHRTDRVFKQFVDFPEPRAGEGEARLRLHLRALGQLEVDLAKVLESGTAEPGLAALARLGDAYEAMQQWVSTPVAPLDPETRALYAISMGCDYGYPQREKAIAAWKMVVTKGFELRLHGTPPVVHALERLQALDTDEFPPRYETFPAPWSDPSFEQTP